MNVNQFVRLLAGGTLALLLFTGTLSAEPEKTIEQRLAELEQEMQLLKRLREVEREVQIKKETETPVVVAGKDGFGLQAKDKSFVLKLKGQVQADGRYYIDDDRNPAANQYLMRRVRPTLEGTAFKYFDFRLMPDFGGGTTALQDAYVDFKYWPAASLRAGKFKSPLSLDRLQTDANKMFIEDALSNNLAPNRDVGLDLHGDLFENALVSYDVGIFNGSADAGSNDTDTNDDKDVVGRIFTHPFRNSTQDSLNGLGFGVAVSAGQAHGTPASPNLPTYRSAGQQSFFSYRTDSTASGTALADGKRVRFAPQAYYYYGPFGVLTEWILANQEIRRANTKADVGSQAGQLALSYVVTGENASYNGVVPRNNFDPSNGKWGAVELVSRLSWLSVEDDVLTKSQFVTPTAAANEAQAWAIGLNWYLNKNLKLSANFEQTFFDGAQLSGGKDREIENALLTRFQVVF